MGTVRHLHPVPTYQEVLRAKIAKKEAQQARRRELITEHVANMEKDFAKHQLEIDNLKAQVVEE